MIEVDVGVGCAEFGDELDDIGGTGGDGFSGKNIGALGFNGILEGKAAVSKRGGWGWGGPVTVFWGERVNGSSGLVAGGTGSGGFPKRGGVELDVGCPNTEEFWPPPKADRDEVPPKTELATKGLGVDTMAENAFLGGARSGSRLGAIPNGEGVGASKKEEICEGMGSGAPGA
jgi:hypothetical protein